MKVLDKYIYKYSRIIAIEQLKDYYEAEGYDVKTEYPLARGIRADLYIANDDHKIVIEIKSANNAVLAKNKIAEIAEASNIEYHLMVVNMNTSNDWTIEEIK